VEGWIENTLYSSGWREKFSGLAGSQVVSASPSSRDTLREGKASGSERGKDLRCGHSYEEEREVAHDQS
jgi:hypothetical protein